MKLKPCPFCGEDVSIQEVIGELSSNEEWITCDNCAHCFVYANNEGITCWNHRVYPPKVQAVIEAAKKVGNYNIAITGDPFIDDHNVYGVTLPDLLSLVIALRALEEAEKEGDQ